jgi:hypothetical protein
MRVFGSLTPEHRWPSQFSGRRATVLIGALAVVLAAGTIAFALTGERVGEALYRTFITVSSAGLVSSPGSPAEKAISVALVLAGVGVYLLVLSFVGQAIVARAERELRSGREKKMKKR